MRVGRYSEIEAGHQPRMFFAPEAGRNRLTLGKRISRWFRLTFGQLPRGRDRVEPGLPPELIGTGYKPPYFPPNKKEPA